MRRRSPVSLRVIDFVVALARVTPCTALARAPASVRVRPCTCTYAGLLVRQSEPEGLGLPEPLTGGNPGEIGSPLRVQRHRAATVIRNTRRLGGSDDSEQGWQGRRVARIAGCQNVVTLAGSRVAKKMTVSLFESKKTSVTPQYWTLNISITVIIGFLHRFTENIGLKSMSNMHIYTNECIHLHCNKTILN